MKDSGWRDVASLAEIPLGDAICVDLDGVPLAIVHVEDGRCFAIGAQCPHGRAMLNEGYIDGLEIECPKHNGRFSLVTGEALSHPAREPIATYPCRTSDGRVEVQLQPSESVG